MLGIGYPVGNGQAMDSRGHFPEVRAVAAGVRARLLIYPGEVYRLCRTPSRVSVLAGRAWITFAGQDIVLGPGERVDLPARDDFALFSALAGRPLILEILDQAQVLARSQPQFGRP